jgi:hypothetical protein
LYRLTNSNGRGLSGQRARLIITGEKAFFNHESIDANTKKTNRIHTTDYQNFITPEGQAHGCRQTIDAPTTTGYVLTRKAAYCSFENSFRLDGACEGVTNEIGMIKIEGCSLRAVMDGAFTFALADPATGRPFPCLDCAAEFSVEFSGKVTSLAYVDPPVPHDPASGRYAIGVPLKPFSVLARDSQGQPVPNVLLHVVSYAPDFGQVYFLSSTVAKSDKIATVTGEAAMTGEDGVATFSNLTITAAMAAETGLVVEAGELSFVLLGPFKTVLLSSPVAKVEVLSAPLATRELQPFEASVRVLDASGAPLAGRRCFAAVTESNRIILPPYYAQNAPAREVYKSMVESANAQAVNPLSAPSGSDGVATFANLSISLAYPGIGRPVSAWYTRDGGGGTALRFICDGVPSKETNSTNLMPVTADLRLQWVPRTVYRVGETVSPMPTAVLTARNPAALYNKVGELEVWPVDPATDRVIYGNDDSARAEVPPLNVFFEPVPIIEDGLVTFSRAVISGGRPGRYAFRVRVGNTLSDPSPPFYVLPRVAGSGGGGEPGPTNCNFGATLIASQSTLRGSVRAGVDILRLSYSFFYLGTGLPVPDDTLVTVQPFGLAPPPVFAYRGDSAPSTPTGGNITFEMVLYGPTSTVSLAPVVGKPCDPLIADGGCRQCFAVSQTYVTTVFAFDLVPTFVSSRVVTAPQGSPVPILIKVTDRATGLPVPAVAARWFLSTWPGYSPISRPAQDTTPTPGEVDITGRVLFGALDIGGDDGLIRFPNARVANLTRPGNYTFFFNLNGVAFADAVLTLVVPPTVATLTLERSWEGSFPDRKYVCGTPVSVQPLVRVTDAAGNPVPNQVIYMVGPPCSNVETDYLDVTVSSFCMRLLNTDPSILSAPSALGAPSLPTDASGLARWGTVAFHGAGPSQPITFYSPAFAPSLVVATSPASAGWDYSACVPAIKWLVQPPSVVHFTRWDSPTAKVSRVPPPVLRVRYGSAKLSFAAAAVIALRDDLPKASRPEGAIFKLDQTTGGSYVQGVAGTGDQVTLAGMTLVQAEIGARYRLWARGGGFSGWVASDPFLVSAQPYVIRITRYPQLSANDTLLIGSPFTFSVLATLESGVPIVYAPIQMFVATRPSESLGVVKLDPLRALGRTDSNGVAVFTAILTAGPSGLYSFLFRSQLGDAETSASVALLFTNLVEHVSFTRPPARSITLNQPTTEPTVLVSVGYRFLQSLAGRSVDVSFGDAGRDAGITWHFDQELSLTNSSGRAVLVNFKVLTGRSGRYNVTVLCDGIPTSMAPEVVQIINPNQVDLKGLLAWQAAVVGFAVIAILLWVSTSARSSRWMMILALATSLAMVATTGLNLNREVHIVPALFDRFRIVLWVFALLLQVAILGWVLWLIYRLLIKKANHRTSRDKCCDQVFPRLFLSPRRLEAYCAKDRKLKALHDRIKADQELYERRHEALEQPQDGAASRSRVIIGKVAAAVGVGGPRRVLTPPDRHVLFRAVPGDFFYSQRFLITAGLSAVLCFLAFILAVYIVFTTVYFVGYVEETLVVNRDRLLAHAQDKIGAAEELATIVEGLGRQVIPRGSFADQLAQEIAVNGTDAVLQRVDDLAAANPQLTTFALLLTQYIQVIPIVADSVSRAKDILREIQERVDTIGQSLSGLPSEADIMSVVDFVKGVNRELRPGLTAMLRKLLQLSGLLAAFIALITSGVIWVLMALRYKALIFELRAGRFPYANRSKYSLVSASNWAGIQASHSAFQLLFFFFALWVGITLAFFGPLRHLAFQFLSKALLQLVSVTFFVKIAVNLVMGYVVCDGNDNIRFRALFEFLNLIQSFFAAVTGLATALVRVIALVVGFLLFYSRLDYPMVASPYEYVDPGFNACMSSLVADHRFNSPALVGSVRLLSQLPRSAALSKKDKKSIMAAKSMKVSRDSVSLNERYHQYFTLQPQTPHQRAKVRWALAYSLVNNPSLRAWRDPHPAQRRQGEGSAEAGQQQQQGLLQQELVTITTFE